MWRSRLGLWRTDETGRGGGVEQCNGCRVLAFVPQLERRESGTTGEEDGAAAASDFRIEDEMGLNFTL